MPHLQRWLIPSLQYSFGKKIVCGRFTLRTNSAAWCQQFLSPLDPENLAEIVDSPRYNIAPTQSITCVLRTATTEPPQAVKLRWGLVPSWADDLSIGNRMINARGETVDRKPSFRKSFASRRCLILSDGYFEWKKVSDGKQPYLIERPDGGIFAMAGIWDENQKVAADGAVLRTCTVITTAANQVTSDVHDRMPVILDPSAYDRWLDPAFRETEQLQSLLQSAPNEWLQLTPVSRRVNSPKHDDPQCIEPVA